MAIEAETKPRIIPDARIAARMTISFSFRLDRVIRFFRQMDRTFFG